MDESRNMFKRGMDLSMVMGLYTTVTSIAMLYIDMAPPLALVAMVLILGGPVVLYMLQRRTWQSLGGSCTMWDLWRMGVVAIFFGTILTALVTYGVLEFLRPSFLYAQLETALETYKQIPEMKDSEMVQALQMMIDEDMVPTSSVYVLNMWTMTNCFGMVMGIFTAMFASRGGIKRM